VISRETIYSALFARLSAAGPFVTTSRKLKHWNDVKPPQQPAMFQAQKTEVPQQTPGLPTKWMLATDVYVYARAPGSSTPSTIINPLLDAIEAALAPDPITNKCTLGGLVQHAWIDGEIQTDEGTLGDQTVAIIPIRILAS